MSFDEVLDQVRELLRQRGRVSYGALKRRFDLDDAYVKDITSELVKAERVAADENGEVLVWVGTTDEDKGERIRDNGKNKEQENEGEKGKREKGEKEVVSPQHPTPHTQHLAERRQLTVLFCDLVGSTALSAQLDPEDYRTIVQRYQQTCAEVIVRHEGYLAQYWGDGLLVYFGYPTAHEDDARRAVRVGLEIISAIEEKVPSPLAGEPVLSIVEREQGERTKAKPLQVRIGIHTGLVVIGEIGSMEKRELLALGETPNVAARIQGLAEPNTVFISAATQRLVEEQFECQPFGSHLVKGIDTPIAVYHVQNEQQSVSPLAGKAILTPLVGREQEVGLLVDRWEQAKERHGQVVLLSGEPGIGKSRLAYTLRESITAEGSLLFEARCSPYHQHSAFYPLIDVLQRTLLFSRQDTDEVKVAKLERALELYELLEAVPLFTALLSLPTPSQYPPLTFTPQKQKERTLQALVQLLVAQAERQATVSVWEDLHWADPSSLEFLSLLIEQIPTTNLLLVLTFRPEFVPPWKPRSHISQLVLNRLGKKQVEAMIEKVAERKDLSAEVIEQIREKTDGVPLFVEELTKSVIESTTGVGEQHAAPLRLTIPATLQEALLARLDRLSDARQVAQLAATLGREFSHELIQAVAPLSEPDLHAALEKLVEAEILHQRGTGEQARYFFKHALIQDTAYQSLLKSTRQQYHQQIARILEERFPDTKSTQPELLAHHYTEANLIEKAIPYWQQAGERAMQRSAKAEAVGHLTKGLELLKTLPGTAARTQQELMLRLALIDAFFAIKGYGAPEVEKAAARAQELCQQLGETPLLFPVLLRLFGFYIARGELQKSCELGEQMMRLAQSVQDRNLLSLAHFALGATLSWLGEPVSAWTHLEPTVVLDDAQKRPCVTIGTLDLRWDCLNYAAWTLWHLGYPDQALKWNQEALTLARGLSQSSALAATLAVAGFLHHLRREEQLAREQAEATMTLTTEQGLPYFLAWGLMVRGWALAEQGYGEEGTIQIRQGLATLQATGAVIALSSWWLALLAETCGKVGQTEEGLGVLAEALVLVDKTGERLGEAELYRLKGELTLRAGEKGKRGKGEEANPLEPKSQILDPKAQGEAEAYFLKAIEIARKQQAKSWELRASTSLARLWQQQGKKAEAHKLLSDVYNWFTEGFDTKDLQEAKALLAELSD